ncbi:MAG: putative Ig domain-containing protein [Actinomycetota bacterium]|nr:putative Ig domain-containing protein [Actinomycetota bacterium]
MNRDPWLNGARLTRTVVAVALVLGVLAGAFETVAALPAGATGTAPSLADGWATYVPGATTPVTFDVLSLVAGGPSGADPTSLTVVAAPPFADAMAAVTSPGSITLTPSATASGSFSLTFGLCAPGVATWTESDPTCARAEVTYAEPVAQTVGYHFTLAGTRSGREKLDFAVDAPPSVPATGVMTVTVALAPISIQTTQTGFNLTYADEISTMLPVPAGLTYVPTSLEAVGGTANLAHSSTVRYCTAPGTGCTGTDSGNFATTAPYLELRTGATPTGRIEGGTTGTLPTIRAEFKATGSVATTVSFETTQFEMTVATVLSVMINAFPSTATRQLPPPYEPPVALSTTTIVTPIPAPTLTGVVPVSGPPSGGTTVTLSGTNLSGTSAVDFGTAAATTVTVAPTGSSLTAKAPPHLSGPVPVSVTTPGGTVTSPGAFTFVSSTPAFTLSCPALSTDTAPTWPLVVTGRLAPDPVDAGRTVAPVTLAVGTRIPVGLAQQLAGKIVEVTLDETGAVVDAAPTAAGLSFAGSVAVPVSTQIPTTGVPVTMAGTSTPRSAIAASSGTVTLSQGSTATLELTAGGTTVGPASCTQPTETLGTAAITPAPASLAITTATLPTGTEGTAYGSTLVAGGGTTPYTWTATGLPAGLSLSRTGSITGVPTTQGHFTVEVTVTGTSATPSATATLALFVNGPPPAISTEVLAAGAEGASYETTLTAHGGTTPYRWTATGLPAGLHLSSTGSITGTPTTTGASTVVLTVTSPTGRKASATFTLSVTPALAVATTSLPAGAVGYPYSSTLSASGGLYPFSWTASGLPPGLSMSTDGSITGTPTTTGTSEVTVTVTGHTGVSASEPLTLDTTVTPAPPSGGYLMPTAQGGVTPFGPAAQLSGSMGDRPLDAPVVGIAAAPTGQGYWEVAADGGVFAFGPGAPFYGSMGGQHLNAPVVGIAAAPAGHGYWEVAADGGVFAFGPGAAYEGSMGGQHLNSPVVGIAAAPTGPGYWEVAADGGVFAFGPGAAYEGSMGGQHLDAPVVGIAAAPTGPGYWEVAADGGVFAFGPGAPFYGSMGGLPLDHPIVGLTAVPATPEAPGHQPIYLALGDSAPMWDGTASYPDLITTHYQTSVPGLRLVNLSQSGATTTSMLQSYFTSTSQLQRAELYLRAYRGSVALVTIDIGGNDVLPCTSGILSGTGTTTGCLATVESRMIANLHTILTGLRQAAGPGVRIVGMTYYNPFLGDWLAGGTARAGVIGSTQALEQLNGLLTQAYTQTGAQVADVEGAVDATDLSTLVPSTWGDVPVAVTRACSLLDISCTAGQSGLGGDDPTVAGAAVIAQAFESTIGTLSPP